MFRCESGGGYAISAKRPTSAGKVNAKMPCRPNKCDGDQWFDLVPSWLVSFALTSNDTAGCTFGPEDMTSNVV